MKHKPLPSSEVLEEWFDYCSITGTLTWRKGRKTRGKKAGAPNHDRIVVRLNGQNYKAHRLIYCLVTGIDPGDLEIDHKNGNASDNRFDNLRLATRLENSVNQKLRKSNTSGFKGVYWCKKVGAWLARLRVAGKKVYVGKFQTPEAAFIALNKVRETHHKEFANHGAFTPVP